MADDETVMRVNFYTAYVAGRVDADAVGKQQAYLVALKTVPEIHIESGKFRYQRSLGEARAPTGSASGWLSMA